MRIITPIRTRYHQMLCKTCIVLYIYTTPEPRFRFVLSPTSMRSLREQLVARPDQPPALPQSKRDRAAASSLMSQTQLRRLPETKFRPPGMPPPRSRRLHSKSLSPLHPLPALDTPASEAET